MKKILLAVLLLTSFSYLSKLNAQTSCGVTNTDISKIAVSTNSNGQCQATFDLQFDITANPGAKNAGIYIYTGTPPVNLTMNGNVPSTSELNTYAGVLAVLQLNFPPTTAGKTEIAYTEGGSSSLPNKFIPSLSFTKSTPVSGTDHYLIQGITVVVPDCSSNVTLQAGIGFTQGSFKGKWPCFSSVPFVPNTPALAGLLGCGTPRYFTFTVKTLNTETITFSAYSNAAHTLALSPAEPFDYTYTYKDANGNDVPQTVHITSYSNITLNVNANLSKTFGQFPFFSTNGTKFDVYMVIKEQSNPLNTNSLQIENSCSALPVVFKSFNAARSNEKVNLTWETASEVNNRGFNVQRNTTGVWKTVGFVFSRSENGNSGSTLSYAFPDVNLEKGIAQYRIEQVDLDGRAKYSEIRSVRGLDEAAGKMSIFPNPTANGKVTILFENEISKRDVIITDISGRVVKQLRGVVSNNLVVENLTEGVYSVQVTDLTNAKTTVQKVVVTKR